jgi:transposase
MAGKNYSEEFRRQAVELYESTAGATVRGIAADLGIERNTLRTWLDRLGTGRKTTADDTGPDTGEPPTPQQRLARLEAENTALRAEKAKLETEREILRSAAKYFAGETNW